MTQADWYVPSVNGSETQLPDGLFITMFDAKNHVDEGLSNEQIKQEYERNAKAVGEYVLSLSPERLALHETIVTMSLKLKFKSEDDFVEKFQQIYNEAVLPKIEDKKHYLEQMKTLRRKKIEQEAQAYFSGKGADSGLDYKGDFDFYNERFEKNFERYSQKLDSLSKQSQETRLNRAEREEMKQTADIVKYMRENKERILVDLVANSATLKENKRIVEAIVSGKDGVFDSHYMDQFEKLTQHTADTRQAFLIVGGAASGKGGVTAAAKKEQKDGSDLLEINPDLYKKLLLPYEEIGPNIEYHAALTHAESSIVFDSIAERWQKMAENGKAPNILMDVVRAGKWQVDVMTSGNTKLSVNTPMLPVPVALERSYQRGQKTGRYVPTRELITGHKEQIFSNKNAMKRGIDYKFYDTNVEFGKPVPLVAEYNAKNKKMTITDMKVMWDYFAKSQLNPEARSAEDLSFATPKNTAKEIVEHAEFTDIAIKDKDGKLLVALAQRDGKTICAVDNFASLQQQMGDRQALDFLVGLKQNDVILRADEQVLQQVDQALKEADKIQTAETKSSADINCEQYAQLLEKLVNEGERVGKTESIYLYDFANDPELKDKKLTIITKNMDVISQKEDKPSYNVYDPEQQPKRQNVLIIDKKVYNTPEKREALIKRARMMLMTTGEFKIEGIYMNERRKIADDYLFDNSGKSEIQVAAPNPEAVRVACKITDKAVTIPVQWDASGYVIEKDGSIVVREKDMLELKAALKQYRTDGNPEHILQPDGKAKLDVYGTDPFFVEDNYSHIYSDEKFRDDVAKVLTQGTEYAPKNSAKYDNILAYEVQKDDRIIMPDGMRLKEGELLCIPSDQVSIVQKQLDNHEPLTGVYGMRKETLQKSYTLANDGLVFDDNKNTR